jgi:hypothetical protein
MDLVPAVATPELAAAALASPLLADAIKLAKWIGDGKELTSDGLLRPDLVASACELLGIELPEDDDSESLDVVWEAALEAGFITVGEELAKAVDLPTDPDEVLRAWLSVALVPFGIPDGPCAVHITVLGVLADALQPVSVLALMEEVLSDFPADDDEEEGHDHHHDDTIGHATLAVFGLRSLGAISVTELEHPEKHTMLLTPLGQMLADAAFAALTLVPDDMASTVVGRFSQLTPRLAAKIVGPWLAGRPTVDAARELLDYAAYARADLRSVAVTFVYTLGHDAAPAWRERVKDRGVGVYAREWLSEHGENVPMDGRDADWMQVEGFSVHVAGMPEQLVVTLLADLAAHEPDALPHLRRAVNSSRHPDAPRLMDAIGQATGRPAVITRNDPPVRSTPTGTTYRITVALRHVESPEVRREVAVDAGTTLAELHEIIQAAMGWNDEHAHRFSFGYDEVDEAAPLGRLLRKPGDTILYTYDFGDDWEHDVILGDIDHNYSGDSLPVLLSGQGACPPEDCGGALGYQRLKENLADPGHEGDDEMAGWFGSSSFDPEGFSLADAAAAVLNIGVALSVERRPAEVIRVQPRRKKRRR